MKKKILTMKIKTSLVGWSFITACLALMFVGNCARAQDYPIYSAVTLSSTATCAGSAATNIAVVIDCRKQKDVTLYVKTQLDAAATDAITLACSRSIDGETYSSQLFTIPLAPNGTTAVNIVTNLASTATAGSGYIKINYVTNAAATAALTNLVIKYGLKINAP